jgi:hypothetical protein
MVVERTASWFWLWLTRRGFGAGLMVMITAVVMAGCGGAQRTGAVPSGEYSFWPPLPNEPRIQFLRSYAFSADVEPPRGAFDKIVFGAERAVLPIAKPYGVDMWNGRIYVCDITNPGVVILDLVEKQTRLMWTRGVEQMVQPTDIAIAPDGMKYVADRRAGRIFVFNAEDRHVVTFGETGLTPAGVAVRGRELFVPDFETQTVLVLDRFKGNTLRAIGSLEGEEKRFIRPLGVEADGQGYVYVTDVIAGRLQKFTTEGEPVLAVGEIADAAGNFVRPKHLVVDRDGIIYVVDAAFQNVQMFNNEGDLLMFFGSPGPHPGSMSLPAGIAVSDGDVELFEDYVHPAFEAERIVVVTNQFGLNKVSVYALGRLREGKTIEDIAPYAAEVYVSVPEEASGAGADQETATPGEEAGSSEAAAGEDEG